MPPTDKKDQIPPGKKADAKSAGTSAGHQKGPGKKSNKNGNADGHEDSSEGVPGMQMAAALAAAEKRKVLDLCNLELEVIPDTVWNHAIVNEEDDIQTPLIPILREVLLSNNKLSIFEGWSRLVNITDLALDFNHLVDKLPDDILSLTNLTRLNIQSNKIRQLPPLGNFLKLVELRANDNALQSIPPSIGALTDLVTLEVSFNQLVMLPDELGDCRHLAAIRARGNELKTLPVTITKLWMLEELMLDKNPLVRMPYGIASMPLRQLTYDIELLQSPPLAIAAQGPEFTMHYLKLLRAAETRGKLEIDELKLDMVPVEVCELYSLTTLSMQRDEIRLLPPIIAHLSRLESLTVAYNKIEQVPAFLTALHRLATLDLSHNLITLVPRAIGYCTALASLDLAGNHVFSPPPMILKMGTAAVMAYLKELCDADRNAQLHLNPKP